MDCIQQSLPLVPVTGGINPSITRLPLPMIDLDPLESVWPYYLAQYPTLAIFNESATEEAARQSLLSCREWDDVCQDPRQAFASATKLGVCSLYYNLTTALKDTTSRTAAIRKTETMIPTCLVSYCAQDRSCSLNATTNCNTASLISTNGHLSSQGVGRCWAEICESFTPSVSPDIAGLGLQISYLMQTVISFSALAFLGLNYMYRKYYLKTETAHDVARDSCFGSRSVHMLKYMEVPKEDKGRVHFWLCSLSDFHKAQCFYSIALQIASFFSIYGDNRDRADYVLLLLVNTDGILPEAMSLYTLLLLGHAEVYDMILAGVSALLASVAGLCVILGFPSVKEITGRSAPSSCGGLPSTRVCNIGLTWKTSLNGNFYFSQCAIIVDILIVLMILRFVLSQLNILDSPRLQAHSRIMSRTVRKFAVRGFHLVIVLVFMVHTAINFYWFSVTLRLSNPAVSHDWSFGQVVGIAIWFAFIFDLIRYEINKALFHKHQRENPISLSTNAHTALRQGRR